ncbi:MAG: GDP-mannose 4,6-dehydratase [Caldilineaceae bacterium]|nr:GDP-mannose 4,6-dehydratase [Caldilineaceae bacterium]MCB9138276.1 GDP-mannose 4,6-dehydratase [Caldilineaceae bacterium]
MRIFITGIAGFAGSHLTEYLLSVADADIHGAIHRHNHRIQHLLDRLTLHRGDLRNALWVRDLIESIRPDAVLHLAAWSDVGGSWQQPWTTYELNIQCQLNLLEAVRRTCPRAPVVVITSNEIYGLVRPDDLPINEETPFRPNSPYGVSKVTQDVMAFQYWQSHNLPTLRMRSFNHIGPGQSDDFAASSFARQIAEIEAGQRAPVMHVGNLSARRDFTDVRDVVRAYWLALLHGEPGCAYNVGSGRSYAVQEVLDKLLALTDASITLETDPARLRPSDVPVSVCDNRRLTAATGWRPDIPLERSLADLLSYWRGQTHGGDL